jgi:hypothetical protein
MSHLLLLRSARPIPFVKELVSSYLATRREGRIDE